MTWSSLDEDEAIRMMTDNEAREYVRAVPRLTPAECAARNRRPEMYFHAHDPEGDSGVMCWLFPRGMKDKDIRAEVSRQGYDENRPCRCSDGDCCGATFTRGLTIEQGRHGKRATMFTGRCL